MIRRESGRRGRKEELGKVSEMDIHKVVTGHYRKTPAPSGTTGTTEPIKNPM